MSLLVTARLSLRRLEPGDAPFVLELLNDPGWLAHIGDRGVRDLAAARDYIETGPLRMYARHGFGLYLVALRESGTPVGMCGLVRRDGLDDVDIGFAFLAACCRRGYATEAATAVLRHAREDLGIGRVVAITLPGNAGSRRVLERIGLVYERRVRLPGDEAELLLYGTTPGRTGP